MRALEVAALIGLQKQEAREKITKLQDFTDKLTAKFDPKLSKEHKAVMLKQVEQVAASISQSLWNGADFQTQKTQAAAQQIVRKLEELKLSLTGKKAAMGKTDDIGEIPVDAEVV